jgi:hypothetical protein
MLLMMLMVPDDDVGDANDGDVDDDVVGDVDY